MATTSAPVSVVPRPMEIQETPFIQEKTPPPPQPLIPQTVRSTPQPTFLHSPPVQYKPNFNTASSPSILPHPSLGLQGRVYATQQTLQNTPPQQQTPQTMIFQQTPPKTQITAPVYQQATFTPPPPQQYNVYPQVQNNPIREHTIDSQLPILPITETSISPPSEKKSSKLRPERVTDPAIQELKCVHGGNYRYSISKQSFCRVRCPFCYKTELNNADPIKVKMENTMVRAEYWRRHMTEVHNKDNQREQTHNLVLCLTCFKQGQEQSKIAKEAKQKLPDFVAVFMNEHDKFHHRLWHDCEVEFGSIWEKKEQPTKKDMKVKKEKKKEIKLEAVPSPVTIPPPPPRPQTSAPLAVLVEPPKMVIKKTLKQEISSPLLSADTSGQSGLLISSTFNDQTFNFQVLAPETLNTDCSFNEFMPPGAEDCNYGNNEISQVLEGCTNPVVKKEKKGDEKSSSVVTKKEEISKIKCDKNEAYLWNPRLYYEKTICPLCPLPDSPTEVKFKELTTPHFRKHLEQVHTLAEILQGLGSNF